MAVLMLLIRAMLGLDPLEAQALHFAKCDYVPVQPGVVKWTCP